MSINDIFNFFTSLSLFSLFIKLFGIIFGGLYLLFAIIMIRQIEILKNAINVHDQGILLTLSYLQTFFAAIVFIYALLIL